MIGTVYRGPPSTAMVENQGVTGGQLGIAFSFLARTMHRFSSRSDESADLSALRHARGHPLRVGPRKRTVRYVEEAD